MNSLLIWLISFQAKYNTSPDPFRVLRCLIIINLIVCRNPEIKKAEAIDETPVSGNLSYWDE